MKKEILPLSHYNRTTENSKNAPFEAKIFVGTYNWLKSELIEMLLKYLSCKN